MDDTTEHTAPPAPSSCKNCHHPLEADSDYCPSCGQKVQPVIVPIKTIIAGAIGDMFNLDSRFFNTIKKLFIPGALTKAFFEGKRQQYYTPFRILFILLLLGLAVNHLIFAPAQNIENILQNRNNHHNVALDSIETSFKTRFDNIKMAFPTLDSAYLTAVKDSVLYPGNTKPEESPFNFSLWDNININMSDTSTNDAVNIDMATLLYKPIEDINLNPSGVERSPINIMLIKQSIKLVRSPKDYVASLISNLVWMILLVIPILALVLMLLYISRGFYYIQHLVFLFHDTAFQVLLNIIGMILSIWLGNNVFFFTIPLGIIYQWIGFRRTYRESLLKGIIKYTFFVIMFVVIVNIWLIGYVIINLALM